jgi:HK97 family phage portal protein
MPVVRSFGALTALADPTPTWASPTTSSRLALYSLGQTYAEIYRTQPNVRICVDFLARNIAQLALHAFRRVSDTDRVRLADHQIVQWLARPNPSTTRYRLIEDLVCDLGLYFAAYWLKVRYVGGDGRQALGLVRLPPDQVTPQPEGGILPSFYQWTRRGQTREFPVSEVVRFTGYNPLNALEGLSPLETLRRILAEESAAGEHRAQYWMNAGRMEGVIEQAKDGPTFTREQQQGFREQWQEFSHGGSKAGMTALLPKGMTIRPWSFSPKDSEYIEGGKLRREVCAAAYHIPQPMVGILEHATFSNIREQHKHLYQDTLGPWLEMIVEELEAQVLPECEDTRDVYLDFNISAKLQGSLEERAVAIHMATRRAWRTVNEARALDNLPRLDDPEFDRVAPQQGGPSDASAFGETSPVVDEGTTAIMTQAARQRRTARLEKAPIGRRVELFTRCVARWQRELTADLTPLVGDTRAALLADAELAAHLRDLVAEAS